MKSKQLLHSTFIFLISLFLFFKPAFSLKPLGLDALGHLSKISYLKEFPFASWDMSWYSGTLFLKLYSPLSYWIISIFPNPILAMNLLGFLSITFCAIGIYLYIFYLTKKHKLSLLTGILFLTTLSLSFYYISVGNHPWVSALWAIPLSILFLEKSLQEKKKKYFVIFSLIFASGILTHVLIGFLIGLTTITRILSEKISFSQLKKTFSYCIVPVLLSSFWFLPFLFYSLGSSQPYSGKNPLFLEMFGIGDQITWGHYSSAIGIIAIIFLVLFIISIKKGFLKQKPIRFLTIISLLVFLLYFGALGNRYPYGVSAVRFVLPLSIFMCIFIGISLNNFKLSSNKKLLVLFSILILMGLMWNFSIINKNFQNFSYHGEGSRYEIFQGISINLPLENNFTNYRFGTSKYVFGEVLNYFYPMASQTFGYQDAGMLDESKYYDMRWNIWISEDIETSFYWLDWFAIKYFEVEKNDKPEKFLNDTRFSLIYSSFGKGYDFYLFEYKDAKPIISLVTFANETSMGEEKKFYFERKNPDEVKITYDGFEKGNAVVFKEFYHKSWKAKDFNGEELGIEKVGPGFMAVFPSENSRGIIFSQQRILEEYLGLIFSILGITFLIFPSPKTL